MSWTDVRVKFPIGPVPVAAPSESSRLQHYLPVPAANLTDSALLHDRPNRLSFVPSSSDDGRSLESREEHAFSAAGTLRGVDITHGMGSEIGKYHKDMFIHSIGYLKCFATSRFFYVFCLH